MAQIVKLTVLRPNSDDTDVEDNGGGGDGGEGKKKKGRGPAKIWVNRQCFDITEQGNLNFYRESWRTENSIKCGRAYKVSNDALEGTMKCFPCTQEACPKEYRVFTAERDGCNSFYEETNLEHNHSLGTPDAEGKKGICKRTQKFIENLRRVGGNVNASNVSFQLREHNRSCTEVDALTIPTAIQFYNYNHRIKRKKKGSSGPLVEDDIDKIKNAHSIESVSPSDLDTPFFVLFEFEQGKVLRMGITTHRLLQFGDDEDIVIIHQDATYKVTTSNSPCIVIGFSDKAKVFHPIIIGISAHETQADYVVFLQKWKEHRPGLALKYAMSDSAAAIQNAAKEMFPSVKILMCFVHVLQNVQKQANCILDSDVRDRFITDLLILRRAWSDECFEKVFALFMTKWATQPNIQAQEVSNYLKQSWYTTERNRNWYAGAAPGYNLNNNNLESTNRYIKEFIQRSKKDLISCLQLLLSYMRNQSERHNTTAADAVVLHTQPSLGRKEWELANRWQKLKKENEILTGVYEGLPLYLTVSKNLSGLTTS